MKRKTKSKGVPLRFWPPNATVCGASLVLLAVGYAGWQIGVAMVRTLTPAEAAIGELIVLIGGVAGSFLVSRGVMRGHARSAFRRLISMYQGFGRIKVLIEANQPEESETALLRIGEIASIHYDTVKDALDDWHDLVPREVDELRETMVARERRSTGVASPRTTGLTINPNIEVRNERRD